MKELARDGIPVTVTCPVLKLARQPYYRWLAHLSRTPGWWRGNARTRCSTRTATTRSSGTGWFFVDEAAEHRTAPVRIVGYSISDRMKSCA